MEEGGREEGRICLWNLHYGHENHNKSTFIFCQLTIMTSVGWPVTVASNITVTNWGVRW